MISVSPNLRYWNYYLTIEKDLINLARYVEFAENNLHTYSYEMARLLQASSAEVDVVMKELCKLLAPGKKSSNIDDYRAIIADYLPQLINEEIIVARFGLSFMPWENWSNDVNPDWWRGYNKVKHQRNDFFHLANLQNTLNAVGGLHLTVVYFYQVAFTIEESQEVTFKETTKRLLPEAELLEINADYYYGRLIG